MDCGIDASSILSPHQPADTVEQRLAEVDELLKQGRTTLRFPPQLEASFRSDMALARIFHFTRIGFFGIFVYNVFIPIDYFILPDIIAMIVFVQTVVISPVLATSLILIKKRVFRPELAVTINLMMIIGSIILFYSQSHAPLAGFLIFTIPVCLAFGTIVLPLPFGLSAWFTGFCVVASTVAVLARSGQDPALTCFAIVINVNAGAYMLIATFRMEASERHAYLVNVRERLRAEILDAKNMLLRNLSETDALTGIANRRAFDDQFTRLWVDSRDRAELISMLMVDIDHFKRLNDTHGHQAGDRALRCVAACLQQHMSPGSIVARYGGEEFAVLIPGGRLADALACAEILREAIEHLHATDHGAGLPTSITVSIGLAVGRPSTSNSCTDLLSATDQALYRAKATGRNRVVSFSDGAIIPSLGAAQVTASTALSRPEVLVTRMGAAA